MIYVVTWIVTNVIGIHSPVKYSTDEFGRRKPVDHQYLIKYWDETSIKMTKEFNERDSAISFYKRGYNKVDDMNVDSVYVFTSK